MTDTIADRLKPCPREGICEMCNREYRVWAAASPLWNAVIRGGSINGHEEHNYLCADCFMELAEDRGIASCFHLDGDARVPLQTVTPSGRVWNPKARLFEAAMPPAGRVEELEALVALADAAYKCAEAPHFIVQPFLSVFRKHGETIARVRAALRALGRGKE